MIYLKRILVGAAGFVISVVIALLITVVIALSMMMFFPQVALRIFPVSYHELGWGGYYVLAFTWWQPLIVGVLALFIALLAQSEPSRRN